MKKFTFFLIVFNIYVCSSQIGINNIDPKAMLDISVTNPEDPTNIDGILIPRIDNFPSEDPNENQDAMLVFLNSEIEISFDEEDEEIEPITYPRGFYYWNNIAAEWIQLQTNENKNFIIAGSTEAPNSISDDIFREGIISVGEESDKGQLNAIVNTNTENLTDKPKTALYVKNSHPSEGSSYTTYGIDVVNESSVNGKTYGLRVKNNTGTTDEKYGIHSQVTAAGYGIHYGIYNETNQESGSLSGIYGIKNSVGKTNGAESSNFGIYNKIGSNTSAGTIYGIYSKATGNASANVFSGYFLGKVSIAPSANEDMNYILPEARGNEGDIMLMGTDGEVTWNAASTFPFTTVDVAIETFTVTPQMSTIRLIANVNEIILPNPSLCLGKVITLIKASGMQASGLNTSGAGVIYDDTQSASISQINASERFRLQSDGTGWIVIGH